jgi:hypothetical protein
MPLLDGIDFMLIGAHAAAVFAPERNTNDVDIIVAPESFPEAERSLSIAGWSKQNDLLFPNTNLGLYGSAWQHCDRSDIDVISTDAAWLHEAFRLPPVLNHEEQRVIPLAYLVLMKVDSARGIDQADLSRMLGRLGSSEIDEITKTVARHHPDNQIADEIHQYAQIGSWEYMTEQELKNQRKPKRETGDD